MFGWILVSFLRAFEILKAGGSETNIYESMRGTTAGDHAYKEPTTTWLPDLQVLYVLKILKPVVSKKSCKIISGI